MRLANAASPVLLFLLLVPDAEAALTVADCARPVTASAVPVSGDCARLERLSARYSRPARSALPVPGTLDPILAELGQVEEPKSLWELFTDWLGDRFRELREALSELPNPLRDLKVSWPPWLAAALYWAGIALLALLALVAVARVLGSLSRAAVQRAISGLRVGGTDSRAQRQLSFADVEAAPAAQRPRILLALVLAALRSGNRLAEDAALSHRQLGPAVREVTPEQRVAIAAIAGLAERVTYSRFVPDAGELTRAVDTSQEVVAGVAR